MPTNLLYIGPLRPETLGLLETLSPAEQALFVTPAAHSEQWEAVQATFPQAAQQITKLAEEGGEHPYYEFNLPEFNASQPASGLYTLYPGLELMESSPQPLESLSALLSDLAEQPANTIVVEQPELVWPLLQALTELPSYKQLATLWLRVGAVPLYQGMPEADEILRVCEEQGFELKVIHEDDPDLPLLQLTRHPLHQRWQEQCQHTAKLKKQLTAAQADLETRNEEAQQLSAQCEQLQKTNKSLQAKLTEQEKQFKALQNKIAQQEELKAVMAQLQKEMNEKFEEQHKFITEAANALGQHITRCTAE